LRYTPKSTDQFSLLVNTDIVALIVSSNSASRVFLWDFRRKDIQILEETWSYRSKMIKTAINDQMLVTFSSDNEISFWNLKNSEVNPVGSLKKHTTFMELSKENRGSLYLAHSKTLSIIDDFTDFEKIIWRDVEALQKVVALHIVKLASIEIILTGHKNPIIRLWRRDLIMIREVNLLDVPDSPRQQSNSQCSYRIHYITERDELVISHNENITIYKMISGTVVHQELQAHRNEITEITSYKGDPSYLVTVCPSAIRLWRYTQVSDPALNLVGEITVTNVDKVIPVSDVGLYLDGKCYYAGLVLWRHANSYLTRQLKTSRNFS
jgi:hypothetical protein